jgi:integrase
MTDRHVDLLNADIAALQPPSARRMLDIRDKREAGLTLRVVSKTRGRETKRAWCWRYLDAEGMQRRLVFGHWPVMDYREAVEAFRRAKEARARGEDPIEAREASRRTLAGRMTFSGLVEKYEAIKAPNLKTGRETMRLLRRHVEPAIGTLAVADITGDHIRSLIYAERERLARDDKTLREAGRKPRTFVLVNRIFAACGSIFTFALDENLITSTPMPRMKRGSALLPVENAKSRLFADEEIAAFWNKVDDTKMDLRTRTALKLVLLTAMRPGEVLGLTRRDVDLSATFVDRRNGVERVRGNGLVTLRDTKKSRRDTKKLRERLVPLSRQARALIASALKGVAPDREAFLFPAEAEGDTKPMDGTTLSRAMMRRRRAFGFDEAPVDAQFTPHRLRAAAAFLIERLGFGSSVARDVLGHVDASVLRQHYSGYDGLPARLDALEALANEVERIARQTQVEGEDEVRRDRGDKA